MVTKNKVSTSRKSKPKSMPKKRRKAKRSEVIAQATITKILAEHGISLLCSGPALTRRMLEAAERKNMMDIERGEVDRMIKQRAQYLTQFPGERTQLRLSCLDTIRMALMKEKM